MIKVNLLQNSIERTSVDAVETAISSQGTRQTLLVLIALGACIAACAVQYILVTRANTKVKEELVVEQKTNATFKDLDRQVRDLETKNKQVEARINAIQQLRTEQTGPLRLLQMIDARMPVDPGFRLESVKQEKDSMIAIQGYSPSEAKVTEFAKNLEFSEGLFSKFLIQTNRRDNPEKSKEIKEKDKSGDEVIQFTIKCAYNPQAVLTGSAVTGQASAGANSNNKNPNADATDKNAAMPPGK